MKWLPWFISKRAAKPPPQAIPSLPAGVWPALDAASLLQANQRLVTAITALAGTSPDYWEALYQPLLDNFAAFVQQCPASEAHHHCDRGGMLTHSLQVAKLAMDGRKGRMLPPGAAAEEVNRQQHAWTYAIFSAALLHDVGKPCSDQRLRLFTPDGQDTHGWWKPTEGALPPGTYYRVEFVRDRDYRTHELLPPLLARQLTPPAALSWLQQDFPNVWKAWLGYLSGQDEVAGVLGVVVTEADMQSVADDLSGAAPTHSRQIPTAKAKPLSQRLLTGLRFLLDNHQLPLNRPGAAGWFDGSDLWLVSKRVLDDLRTHLEKEGQTGIPSRNDRLMDELQQHGILTPTLSGQAIWNATVKAGTMGHAFTLLRIPATTLWADPAQYPLVMDGSITPDSKDGVATPAKPAAATATQPIPANTTTSPATAGQATATAPTAQAPDAATAIQAAATAATPPAQDDDGWMLPQDMPDRGDSPASTATARDNDASPWGDDDGIPMPPIPAPVASTPAPSPILPQVDDGDAGDGGLDSFLPDAVGGAGTQPTTSTGTRTAPTPVRETRPAVPEPAGDPDSDDTGQRFLHWLSEGLRSNRLPLNTPASVAHVVREGLLLVSPRVFKEYDPDKWEYVQRRFVKLKLHKAAANGSNIWQYHVRGKERSGTIRGMLMDGPLEKLGLSYLPAPNKSVMLPDTDKKP